MSDTIAALATGAQISAIGILRLSGPESIAIADRLFIPDDGAPMSAHESKTLVYGALHDTDGDMLCAVNDMRLMDAFTGDILDQMLPSVNASDVCVIDANLPEKSLLYLAESAVPPLVCDPVSAEKAKRILPLLPRLAAIKPNLLEARTMTGRVALIGPTMVRGRCFMAR